MMYLVLNFDKYLHSSHKLGNSSRVLTFNSSAAIPTIVVFIAKPNFYLSQSWFQAY